jgi:hypothetical protein
MELITSCVALGTGIVAIAVLPIWAMQKEWLRRWATISIISVSGVATVWVAYFLLRYETKESSGPTSPSVDLGSLVYPALPSIFFLMATFMCWSSVKFQRAVAVIASWVGFLCVGVMWSELSRPYTNSRTGPGTGFLSFIAWFVGMGLSIIVVLIAASSCAWSAFRGQRSKDNSDFHKLGG